MQIIYCAETMAGANRVKCALESVGVRAFAVGETEPGAVGDTPRWRLIQVMVAKEDADRALPVAQAIDAAYGWPREGDGRIGEDGIFGSVIGIV